MSSLLCALIAMHKGAHSMNQGPQAGTNGCSLVDEKTWVGNADSIQMHAHLSFVQTSWLYSGYQISVLGLNELIAHQQLFCIGSMFEMAPMMN